MKHAPYSLGFKSQENEIDLTEIPVKGDLPNWLSGSLIRTGPAKFEVGKSRYNHWFDGLAMLYKFSFSDGKVGFSCKFVQSEAYTKANKKQKIVYGEFGTDPCHDIFQKVASFFTGLKPTDNVCVNINLHGKELTSVTETTRPVAFDPETLDTGQHFKYKDSLKGQVTTAHPHYEANGTLYNYMTHLSKESEYIIYSQQTGSNKRQKITSIAVDEPAYMHSFGMTENYIIITEFPIVVSPLKFRFPRKPFVEKFDWKPQNGTRIHLVNKKSGDVKTLTTEPFFAFHHVNAFEDNGDVVFDVIAYKDTNIINEFYLEDLRSDKPSRACGNLWRFRIQPYIQEVEREVISSTLLELPRINYDKVNTRKYRYVFGTGCSIAGNFNDSITKIDISKKQSSSWYTENCYPGEPVFVARPGAKEEDDGVLLSIVLDPANQNSFLLVLDARNLQEIARAEVPQHIPFGFHGQYVEHPDPTESLKTLHR